MSSLSARLAERIAAEGPISFRDFMEAALYDPAGGYYETRAAIGEGGDFVTSPSLSPLFALTIARAFAHDAESLPGQIGFLEVAAGSGRFLADFRQALERRFPEVACRTRFIAVERSARGREEIRRRQSAQLVTASVEDPAIPAFRGWVFSNELYDALPVHRVEGHADGPRELLVGREEGRFVWVPAPAPTVVAEHLARFGVVLSPGQRAEVCLEAAKLHGALCRRVTSGRVVVFDYGHRAAVLYHPHARPDGTLAVHSRGRRGGDPLATPGEVDLTAHVNWDDVIRAGEIEGLRTDARMRQYQFLLAHGLFEEAAGRPLEALRIFDPEGIGESLSVLVQSRGLPDWRVEPSLTSPV
jgi:SAM-dependent MidA family methyltransferase